MSTITINVDERMEPLSLQLERQGYKINDPVEAMAFQADLTAVHRLAERGYINPVERYNLSMRVAGRINANLVPLKEEGGNG